MKVFVLKDYPYMDKPNFAKFLTSVSNGVFVYVLVFLLPPVTGVNFLAAVKNYNTANENYELGGKGFKGAYTTTRNIVLGMLDLLHDYVNKLPNLTSEMALLSGFNENNVITGGIASLGVAIFYKSTRMATGVLKIEYHKVTGAKYYGIILVEGGLLPAGTTFFHGVLTIPEGNHPKMIFDVSQQRVKTFSNLTVNTEYNAYAFSGNANGVSALSVATPITISLN